MPTYDTPNDKMIAAYDAARAMEQHADRLAGVNIELIATLASRDNDNEPRGEALQRGGRKVLGDVRIIPLEDRTAARNRGEEPVDVRIILNSDRWGSTSKMMQVAVLDNCLTSIEVITKDDQPVLDACDRPKLRKRKPDYILRGYVEVAERHGKSSVEVHELRVLVNDHGQTFMPWLDDGTPIDNAAFADIPKKAKPASGRKRKGKRTPTAPKPAATGKYEIGACKPKRIAERLGQITRPETVLGVAALEFASGKKRKPVINAMMACATRMQIAEDLRAVEVGRTPTRTPDLAAGVLVTSPANLDPSVLEQLVPECGDQTVLDWILEDEKARKDGEREEVTDAVASRISDIRSGGSLGATVH